MRNSLFLAALAATLGSTGNAAAQTYPSRSITLVVPYPAGGQADSIARIMAEQMTPSLGQPAIVGNISGAGGSIRVGRAVRAAPLAIMASAV
jgi:tripartite-type tricarboxylate transporter receptor subunit TctC